MTPLRAKIFCASILMLYLFAMLAYHGYCHCEGGTLMAGGRNLLVFDENPACIYEIEYRLYTGPLSEYCYTNPFVEER